MTNHDLCISSPPRLARSLEVDVSVNAGAYVVNLSGELDMTSCEFVEQACLAGDDMAVVVEMAALTFMDCRGYGALVAARRVIDERGGSLTFSHPVGQPARLISLLGADDAV